MKLTIDNLNGLGAIDYTAALDLTAACHVERRINQPSVLRCSVLANSSAFVAPVGGARIVLMRADGSFVFTGYLTQAAVAEYLGVGEQRPVYRYQVAAESDEVLLDQKVLPDRAPFVGRSAGSALKQLVADLQPGAFDVSAVQDVETLAAYPVNPQKKFSYHAGEIALAVRGCYRAVNGGLMLAPVGAASYVISESDANFSPSGLKLESPNAVVNDVTVIGLDEPQAYVRDFFVGDGKSLKFYLSQKPFQQNRPALIDEEFAGTALDPATWVVNDSSGAVSVAAQTVQVNGGSGVDGKTSVQFIEQIELGGALELQHGDVSFTAASQGVLGGLYAGAIAAANCLAGFQITPAGSQSNIQALVKGAATGPTVATTAGHRYLFTTYIYSREVYRRGETYHSSAHPAGQGTGGAAVVADVRFVLEVLDIDPANPASMIAPATVVYDGVISDAPVTCTYALVNAMNMHCGIAYTYVTHISLAEVRTALPNSGYQTQLVESLSDGGQCLIAGGTSLDFYPQYVPPQDMDIVVSYRGYGRAVAQVINGASVAGLQNGTDDGRRGLVRVMKTPSARTQADCENAALALLDDGVGRAWSGSYETWSDFLPSGAEDIFPGDGVTVNVPSRAAVFGAIVRRVVIDVRDPANDRGMYAVEFASDAAASLSLQDASSATTVPLQDVPVRLATEQVGSYYLESLTNAQVTETTSTTVTVDAGAASGSGYGIEVRAHDYGWGVANDRNLLGRFSSRTFTLPRLGRTQNYFLRLYDGSSPPRYSRYAAALHVDKPL